MCIIYYFAYVTVPIIEQIKMCIPVSRITVSENVKLLPPPKKFLS